MASAPVPQKIVLKSTTKMSLNDRFSNIPPPTVSPRAGSDDGDGGVQRVRAQMLANQVSSAKNRRLALQMANRPTVQAALKLKQRSLKQRLGKSDIKTRLSLPANQWRGRGVRGRSLRGQRGQMRKVSSGMEISQSGSNLRGRGQFRGSTPVRPTFRGGRRGRGINRGLNRPFVMRGQQTGRVIGRVFRARGQGYKVQEQNIKFRGGRGFQGRGGRFQRGRGGRRGQRTPATKEALDSQLDKYMSKTKAHLDAELDAYMAQAN